MNNQDVFQKCFDDMVPILISEFLKNFGDNPTDIVLEVKGQNHTVRVSLK